MSNMPFRCALENESPRGLDSFQTCLTLDMLLVFVLGAKELYGKYFSHRPQLRKSLVDDERRSYPWLNDFD